MEVFNNSIKRNATRLRSKLGTQSLIKIGMIKWNAKMLQRIGQ